MTCEAVTQEDREWAIRALRGEKFPDPLPTGTLTATAQEAVAWDARIERLCAALQAPCPGKAGELREKVAAILLDNDEFGNDVGARDVNKGWAERLLAICWATENHSGDCTKQPWTCLKCQGEQWLETADRLLALLSAQPVPSEDQGSVAGEADASSALPRQADKGSATPSEGGK